MWPLEIPSWIAVDERRSSEISVYEKLKVELDKNWTVFYSRPWWGLAQNGAEIDGECDFIVCHEDLGILFIEVKGGRVHYQPESDQWLTTDRHEVTRRIKDPVKQAMMCKHEVLRRLNKISSWPKKLVTARHGVILPHSLPPQNCIDSIGGYDLELFAFSKEFNNGLNDWVQKRMRLHASDAHCPMGSLGLAAVKLLYATPVELKFALSQQVDQAVMHMNNLLTGAQLQMMLDIEESERIVIQGGAGTGKTVVAVEISKRHAEKNRNVLFLCTNTCLKLQILQRLGTPENLHVLTFMDLVEQWTDIRNSGTIWDTVIIDEGQDVDFDWWPRITDLLGEHTKLVVFMDNNQAVYRLPLDIATRLGAREHLLRVNLRNPKSIAEATESLYRGPKILAAGPSDGFPEIRICEDSEKFKIAISLIDELVNEEGLLPSQLAILTSTPADQEVLCEMLSRNGFSFCHADSTSSHSITVERVARFKGLEAPVVIWVANPDVANNRELAYVALSRARFRFYAVGNIKDSIIDSAVTQIVQPL